jgi:hypothetical protein
MAAAMETRRRQVRTTTTMAAPSVTPHDPAQVTTVMMWSRAGNRCATTVAVTLLSNDVTAGPLDSLAYQDQQACHEGPQHDDYGSGASNFAWQLFSFAIIGGPAGRCHQNCHRFAPTRRDGTHFVRGHHLEVGHVGAEAELDHVL